MAPSQQQAAARQGLSSVITDLTEEDTAAGARLADKNSISCINKCHRYEVLVCLFGLTAGFAGSTGGEVRGARLVDKHSISCIKKYFKKYYMCFVCAHCRLCWRRKQRSPRRCRSRRQQLRRHWRHRGRAHSGHSGGQTDTVLIIPSVSGAFELCKIPHVRTLKIYLLILKARSTQC